MGLFYLNAKDETTFVQTMHDETRAAVEAIESDPAIDSAEVTPAGEIQAVASATTTDYAEVGDFLARYIDADVSFLRATRSGRLYFQV